MPKRRATEEAQAEEGSISKKLRPDTEYDDEHEIPSPTKHSEAAQGPRSILRTPSKPNGIRSVQGTPSSLRKVLFTAAADIAEDLGEDGERPVERRRLGAVIETSPDAGHNDRSARKKSQRALLHNHLEHDAGSDDSGDEQDQSIARAILNQDDDDEDDEIVLGNGTEEPATPLKTGKPRGRPRGRRKERNTPSPPPPDLPPHELYFFQNRAGANKTSANLLPSLLPLNHDDYLAQTQQYKDSHAPDVERLKRLHRRAFDQWLFELEEGFNICLHGYGSKHNIAMDFVAHIHQQSIDSRPSQVVVANAYTPGFTCRDILQSLASILAPRNTKLPAQPGPLLDAVISLLSSPSICEKIYVLVHSLDHTSLRKGMGGVQPQTLLARLAAHPRVALIGTCDTLNFPLLWDVSLAQQYRFLYHDATTFEPYTLELDAVESVNGLLGRSGRRLGGKDGVGYVLQSLPENARNLFRILVAEQLALAQCDDGGADLVGRDFSDDDDEQEDDILGMADERAAAAEDEEMDFPETPSKRSRTATPRKNKKPKKRKTTTPSRHAPSQTTLGVEYRTLYHKAVEEFVCSSEVNFRTLLKEFHDHQMIESRKDSLGVERLVLPFRNEELETILEELV